MTLEDWVQKVKTFFMFLGRFLRDTVAWIFGPRHTWLLAIALTFALGVIVFFSCSERTIRLVGLALQLVGFWTVVWGLMQAREQFGRPTIFGGLAQWLARHPKFGPKHEVIAVSGTEIGFDVGKMRGRVSPRPNASLEERIEIFQRQYESLYDEVGLLDDKLDRSKAELSKRIDDEAAARQEADARNQRQLDEAIVGGLHLDWVGVTLFIVGTIASTASPEIALGFTAIGASCAAL